MASELVDFWIIIVFSLLGVLLTTRLRLPSAIGVLAIGALIGPYGLSLVGSTSTVKLLSDLGAILLLFFIGIEFNLDKIAKYGFRAVLVFILKFGVVFLFTYLVALLLDFPILDALVLGVVLSFSSTAIFARLISDSIVQDREETRLMSAVLILEDIFAIFLLTIVAQNQSNFTEINSLIVSTLVSLFLLVVSYILLRWLVQRLSDWLEDKNVEAHLFSALSVCALLTSVAVAFGLAPTVGAFLAGSVFAAVPAFRKVEEALRQLILLFSTFFFFSIGMQVNPVLVYASLGILLLFTLANVVFKFLSVGLSTYLLGFESRQAISAGLLMLTTSEFGLLIASQTARITHFDLLSFSAALMFITSLVSVMFYPREASINAHMSSWVSNSGIGPPLKNLSIYMDYLVRRFEPGGAVYETISTHARHLLFHGAIFLMINAALVVAKQYPWTAPLMAYRLGPFDGLDGIAFILSIYPLYQTLRVIQLLLGEFVQSFHGVAREKVTLQQRMVASAFFFFLFFGLSLVIPLALSLLNLPRMLQPLALIPLLFSFAFIWDLAHLSRPLIRSLRSREKRR